MNHDTLRQVILDQHEIIRRAEIVPRTYVFEKQANYILTGLRRAGKSTMLYSIVRELIAGGVGWERIIYINFEDERLAEFSLTDFNDILAVQSEMSQEKGFYFFDEIQVVPGWEKFCRRLADAKEHVWITGSNAKMLSREMEATLGGRYLSSRIDPYSFEEYLTAGEIPHGVNELLATKPRGRIVTACRAYMTDGGLPESLAFTSKREYLSNVFQKILLGDIVSRNKIRNDYAVRMLIKKLAETVKDEVSYSKLHGTLKGIGVSISKDSLIDYLNCAMDAYLVFPVLNGYAKFSERESTPKYYFADNGILNLFLVQKEGILLENMIAVALYRRYGDGLRYLKSSRTGLDIDFWLPEEGTAIQVCDRLDDQNREREIGNLVRLSQKQADVRRRILVTWGSDHAIRTDEGVEIEVQSPERFLLG